MFQLESSCHGRSVDHVLTYFGRQIVGGPQKPSRITRQTTCCAIESNTSVRVVFGNWSGFDVPIGVFMAWGSVDLVLTYSGRKIAVSSQKPSRIARQNTCCAIVMAWEERGSCLNIFRMINRSRISETFTNYEAKDLLRKTISDEKSRSDLRNLHELRGKRLVAQVSETRRSTLYLRTGVDLMFQLDSSWHGRSVDHVLTYFGGKSRSDLKNLHELRGKRLVAQVSETRRFALYLRTGVDLLFQLESSWHGRSVDHGLTYSGWKISVGSQKPLGITRQNTCCANE
ncbi:uncharacterized protein G2W53_007685 [Senna tora]|uniref:Uncharacterized protein n=1 Tax=Senna tora TaxID=362788 RepID=A0A834X872_9FABA|nr:uncharacterized protein G2W53_007685 [Senna tora]